tara:strand:- start:19552 stop:20112 length:561 start_codon:yes stop_codon:yes gene_type:complete
MKSTNFIDQRKILDELGLSISKNNYEESLNIINKLCLYSPFKTKIFVQLFINAWSAKIINLLDNNLFLDASKRIRSLYLLTINNKSFNILVNKYFNDKSEIKYFKKLKDFDKATHLALKSHYFYQIKNFKLAESYSKSCINECLKLLKKEKINLEINILVKKCLKNISSVENSRFMLEKFIKYYKS